MSAAATAAGYLAIAGKIRPTDQGSELCPLCRERFNADAFEFHLFIAHKRTEAKS